MSEQEAPEEFRKAFRDRLVELRKAKGLSQVELADAVGTSKSQVSRWEAGFYVPKLHTAARLAAALGVEVSALLPQNNPAETEDRHEDQLEHDLGGEGGRMKRHDDPEWESRRVDGSSNPGGKHHGCQTFVLDLNHDEHARPALAVYANEVRDEFPELARDLFAILRALPEIPAVDPVPRPTSDGRRDAIPPLLGSEAVAGFVQFLVSERIVTSGAFARSLEAAAIRYVQAQGLEAPRRGWDQIVRKPEDGRASA